jgi:outer membrane lipoprotein-sorting protein
MLRVAVFLLFTLAGSALAQIDAQSQALLDNLATQQGTDIETIDQTMVMTIYNAGDEIVSSTRTVIDYVNRRAVIFTDIGGGMLARMVHVDGETTMHMEGMPMAMPLPPGMDGAFATIFDPAGALSDDPNAKAVYDGQVSYGDILSGQQVTYTATYDVAGTPTETVSRFIFDADGQYIGTVVDGSDGSVTIMVFDPPTDGNFLAARGTTMYDFKDGVATMTTRTTYENVSINEPLDEALFE